MHDVRLVKHKTQKATRHTLTCDVSRLPSLDTLDCKFISKAYKIAVRPTNDNAGPYTVIGFVLVGQNQKRQAYDVFGHKHNITQAKRLREKHIREAFGIDERFNVKSVCIQVEKQMQSEHTRREPTMPNRPTLRRPKVA